MPSRSTIRFRLERSPQSNVKKFLNNKVGRVQEKLTLDFVLNGTNSTIFNFLKSNMGKTLKWES